MESGVPAAWSYGLVGWAALSCVCLSVSKVRPDKAVSSGISSSTTGRSENVEAFGDVMVEHDIHLRCAIQIDMSVFIETVMKVATVSPYKVAVKISYLCVCGIHERGLLGIGRHVLIAYPAIVGSSSPDDC